MAAAFIEKLLKALEQAGVDSDRCRYDEQSGQLVITGSAADSTIRVVPVRALCAQHAASVQAVGGSSTSDLVAAQQAMEALATAAADVFGPRGAADVPEDYDACGERLLPQLWSASKIAARSATLPDGFKLPHCTVHGEETKQLGKSDGIDEHLGVVLVCEYVPPSKLLPPIETPVLSNDLARWSISFPDALKRALENLRKRTKDGLAPDKRWEHHASGCGQSCQRDRFDSARMVLLPSLVVKRKRPDGVAEIGGHVAVFATSSCVLATTSKNPLGLCFLGDTLHLNIVKDEALSRSGQLLSTTPYRLLKMKVGNIPKDLTNHPLTQKAGEGFVWRWMPYTPGGPPTRAEGEYSIPVDQGEVDAILDAAEAGRPVPVFSSQKSSSSSSAPSKSSSDQEKAEQFASKKEEANSLFKAGDYVKALAAYDAALAIGAPSNADGAIVHSNAAQACLSLASQDEPRRTPCAAEAFKRAMTASQLDPMNAKAHARMAAACEILGEPTAAAEARQKAEECMRLKAEADAAKRVEFEDNRKAAEARKAAIEKGLRESSEREALLERERALEREKDQAEAAKAQSSADAQLSAMLGMGSDLASAGKKGASVGGS